MARFRALFLDHTEEEKHDDILRSKAKPSIVISKLGTISDEGLIS